MSNSSQNVLHSAMGAFGMQSDAYDARLDISVVAILDEIRTVPTTATREKFRHGRTSVVVIEKMAGISRHQLFRLIPALGIIGSTPMLRDPNAADLPVAVGSVREVCIRQNIPLGSTAGPIGNCIATVATFLFGG